MQIVEQIILSTDRNSADQPIVFPHGPGHVGVTLIQVPPGAGLPAHKHLFPRMGFILEGRLEIKNLVTGRETTHESGEFVLETMAQWHEGRNVGPQALKLLVIDLSGPDMPALTIRR